MSLLNDVAAPNVLTICMTLDTSHFEISPLNDFEPMNVEVISVTFDTSHSPKAPFGPSGQSPSGVNCRHVSTAFLSSVLDIGAKSAPVHNPDEMDPGEPSNMCFFVDFESIQASPQSR